MTRIFGVIFLVLSISFSAHSSEENLLLLNEEDTESSRTGTGKTYVLEGDNIPDWYSDNNSDSDEREGEHEENGNGDLNELCETGSEDYQPITIDKVVGGRITDLEQEDKKLRNTAKGFVEIYQRIRDKTCKDIGIAAMNRLKDNIDLYESILSRLYRFARVGEVDPMSLPVKLAKDLILEFEMVMESLGRCDLNAKAVEEAKMSNTRRLLGHLVQNLEDHPFVWLDRKLTESDDELANLASDLDIYHKTIIYIGNDLKYKENGLKLSDLPQGKEGMALGNLYTKFLRVLKNAYNKIIQTWLVNRAETVVKACSNIKYGIYKYIGVDRAPLTCVRLFAGLLGNVAVKIQKEVSRINRYSPLLLQQTTGFLTDVLQEIRNVQNEEKTFIK